MIHRLYKLCESLLPPVTASRPSNYKSCSFRELNILEVSMPTDTPDKQLTLPGWPIPLPIITGGSAF